MTLGAEIEQIRIKCNMPLFIAYDVFSTDMAGYHQIITGRCSPTIFQLIMFIDAARHPLEKYRKSLYKKHRQMPVFFYSFSASESVVFSARACLAAALSRSDFRYDSNQ